MKYYRLMTAWAANDGFDFNFHNAHDLNTARDSSQEESIKRQLRERFANSRDFIVLIGERTKYLTKFVKWEMEVAIRLNLPIIAVNLNGSRQQDYLCPPAIKSALAVYVPFGVKIVEHAMKNWPSDHTSYVNKGMAGPFEFNAAVYRGLGL
jgi:hypothetical protein